MANLTVEMPKVEHFGLESASSSPIISGLVERNCPSFIKVVPIDCNELESLSSWLVLKLISFFGACPFPPKVE